MNRRFSFLYAAVAAVVLAAASAMPVFAATELAGASGAKSTQHYGPYASGSTDSGTCGNDWANDTFDRHFTVRRNADGTLTVIEEFKKGTFRTPATDSKKPNFSPGACQASRTPAGTVKDGVTGRMHGYFVIPMKGQKQVSTDRSCVAGKPNEPCTTKGFVNSHFTPCYPDVCHVATFFFHYSAGDQGLIKHEWRNASPDRGGNSGDIRSANI